MLYLNFLTIAIAISAFTYSNILTEPGMLLFDFHAWADDTFTGRRRWIFQVLINCQFCISGQWSLWYYLYYTLIIGHHYDFFAHVWLVLQTIFIAKVVTWLYYKIMNF